MKFKKIIATIALVMFGALILASCSSNKSGITADNVVIKTEAKTSKSIKLGFTFDKNDKLDAGTASVHVKQYKVENGEETYSNQDLSLTVSPSTHTGSLDFTGLTAATAYRFKLYVTYAGSDSLVTSYDERTSSASGSAEDAVHIKTKDELEKIVNDPSGYYILDNDIVYGTTSDSGTTTYATLPTMFSSSTQFSGTLDGNGHKISYYSVPSNEYAGLFAYASGATIKNLTIENAKVDFSSGRSNTKVGLILGYAERTLVENCKVLDSSITYTASGSAESFIGMVAGRAVNCTFKNCEVKNASLSISEAKVRISAGLFVGCLEDNGLVTEEGVNIAVKKSSAQGTIKVITNFNTSYSGFVAIGGFVGNCNTSGLVTESSADTEIIVSKKSTSTTDEFNLYVGGFIGTNNIKTINVSKCLAATKISVYAGEYKVDDAGQPVEVDYSANKMTKGKVLDTSGKLSGTYFTYLGGFVGRIIGTIDKISDSYALLREEILFNGKLDDSVVVDKTVDISDEEDKAKIKVVSTQTTDQTISFTVMEHDTTSGEVYHSTGEKIALNTELDIKVTNNSSKTLLLTIIIGESITEVEIEAAESYNETITLSDNAVFALEQKTTVVKFLYEGNFTGEFGDAKAKVTNCHTNLDESENEVSEELYNLFKDVLDKYRN